MVDNLDRLDDYLVYQQQLSFVTTGSSIEQSRLLDGILLPVPNSSKLLASFTSNSALNIAFLDLRASDVDRSSSSFSIIDRQQQFFSYDTMIYRQFVAQHLQGVNLVVSSSCIEPLFLFELHHAKINVIDAMDETTFDWLLKVYRCVPCNRLILSDDEALHTVSTVLLDRYVTINQQAYVCLSSNGA